MLLGGGWVLVIVAKEYLHEIWASVVVAGAEVMDGPARERMCVGEKERDKHIKTCGCEWLSLSSSFYDLELSFFVVQG